MKTMLYGQIIGITAVLFAFCACCCRTYECTWEEFAIESETVEGFRITAIADATEKRVDGECVIGSPYTFQYEFFPPSKSTGTVVIEEVRLLDGEKVVFTGLSGSSRDFARGPDVGLRMSLFRLGPVKLQHKEYTHDIRFKAIVADETKSSRVKLVQSPHSKKGKRNPTLEGFMGI